MSCVVEYAPFTEMAVMLETNLIVRRIKDMQGRNEALRGYL